MSVRLVTKFPFLHTGQFGSKISKTLTMTPTFHGGKAVSFASKPYQAFNVCVEGNVASGKTTLIQYLAKMEDIDTEQWDHFHHMARYALLTNMYNDSTRWSFTLQTYTQLKMLEQHIRPSEKPMKMIEGSLYSAQFCFVEYFHKSGRMTDMEYVVNKTWFDWICKSHDLNIGLTVYLQTTPKVVYERIKRRGRSGESNITMEHLYALHELHENWLVRRKASVPRDSHVMVIDGNHDTETIVKLFLNMLSTLGEEIYTNMHGV